MRYPENQFIIARDLSFVGVLHDIKKSKTALQPIFEAFTNALEAIKLKEKIITDFKGEITIKINASETTVQNSEFNSLSITDNGIGFNEEEFARFNTFKLTSKGFKNLGSGRIQYVHYFDSTRIKSVFEEESNFFEREFVISKKENFIKQNAIVKHIHCKESDIKSTGTTVTFSTVLENTSIYNNLDAQNIKETLLERYIHYLCYNKSKLPKIKIKFYVQSTLIDETSITQSDIPNIDLNKPIHIQYSKRSADGKSIEKTKNLEEFSIDAFKISKDILKENKLNLVSKGEVIEESNVCLESLAEGDHVKGFKFLFLVSSEYIDSRDTNMRGILNIPTKDTFFKNTDLFTSEEILIEEIQEEVNKTISEMYPEIEEVKQKHEEEFEKLKEMFLLDDETAKDIKISINDSESDILKKFYEAEAKKEALIDASIKESIDRLDVLNPSSGNYYEELEKEIEHLVKAIPQQNKISLTHYVARRKIVLELFKKILDKETQIQLKTERNIDEKLLHNLIFQQSQSNPEKSDLWLVNEDFIYFKGTSEDKIKDIEIDGVRLLRSDLNAEEEDFRVSLGENRYDKRPDILLFPQENKCIIIEFKNPDVNVSEHLNQISNYASLIWNFSKPEFKINTFYGYLIGEKINSFDVRSFDGDFNEAYNFDYLFRPLKKIPGFFVDGDASLYTEVIKYSTLLDRATKRNEIYIKKLSQ